MIIEHIIDGYVHIPPGSCSGPSDKVYHTKLRAWLATCHSGDKVEYRGPIHGSSATAMQQSENIGMS